MSRVAFTELAENDLTDIWLYIAEDNPDAADRFIDRIYDTCHKTLVPSPESGRARPELADSLRAFPSATTSSSTVPLGKASKSSASLAATAIFPLFLTTANPSCQ